MALGLTAPAQTSSERALPEPWSETSAVLRPLFVSTVPAPSPSTSGYTPSSIYADAIPTVVALPLLPIGRLLLQQRLLHEVQPVRRVQ